MENNFYIYVYLDTSSAKGNYIFNDLKFEYEPFYVGKGSGDRYKQHLRKRRIRKSDFLYERIQLIRLNGYEPIVIKLFQFNETTDINALKMEDLVIEKIGRKDMLLGPLLNRNKGKSNLMCKNKIVYLTIWNPE